MRAKLNSAEAFEAAEEPLDLVALFVEGRSQSQGSTRLDLSGTTGTVPKSSTSCQA